MVNDSTDGEQTGRNGAQRQPAEVTFYNQCVAQLRVLSQMATEATSLPNGSAVYFCQKAEKIVRTTLVCKIIAGLIVHV
eukprot:7391636-Heterocapsa_arctica.AAC.1